MDAFVVTGGKHLRGRVRASGAKNAALPIMAAAILADGPLRLKNVPNLADIRTMTRLLRELGLRVEREDRSGDLLLENQDPSRITAPYSIMRTMRAGICVLGALVARRGKAAVSLPGGCAIGDRPVNLHMKGLKALGAKLEIKHGYIHASCKRLRGSEMYLGGPFGSTVTGTANVLMAAVLAKGTTVIDCAACEPEVQDLSRMLVKMGAQIHGIGSPRAGRRGRQPSLRGRALRHPRPHRGRHLPAGRGRHPRRRHRRGRPLERPLRPRPHAPRGRRPRRTLRRHHPRPGPQPPPQRQRDHAAVPGVPHGPPGPDDGHADGGRRHQRRDREDLPGPVHARGRVEPHGRRHPQGGDGRRRARRPPVVGAPSWPAT